LITDKRPTARQFEREFRERLILNAIVNDLLGLETLQAKFESSFHARHRLAQSE
jgi:hypothetical protein